MKLLVDLGNTRIKWCGLSGDRRTATGVSRHSLSTGDAPTKAGQDHEAGNPTKVSPDLLDQIWAGLEEPEGIVLCNVAGPETGAVVQAWAKDAWGCPVLDLRSVAELGGVRSAYPEPGRLGIDRLVAMIGARSLFEGPICVVDAGTAVTLDAVDDHGQHLGGLIAPGPEMMLTALGRTGDILLDREGQLTEFATSTPDAVVSGVMLSVVALVERFVAATRERLGGNVTLVVTGGAGRRILLNLSDARFEPDLVLQGLAVIAREERTNRESV